MKPVKSQLTAPIFLASVFLAISMSGSDAHTSSFFWGAFQCAYYLGNLGNRDRGFTSGSIERRGDSDLGGASLGRSIPNPPGPKIHSRLQAWIRMGHEVAEANQLQIWHRNQNHPNPTGDLAQRLARGLFLPLREGESNLLQGRGAFQVASQRSTGLHESLPALEHLTERGFTPEGVHLTSWRVLAKERGEIEGPDDIYYPIAEAKIEIQGEREASGVFDAKMPWRQTIDLGWVPMSNDNWTEPFKFSLVGGRFLFAVAPWGNYRVFDAKTGSVLKYIPAIHPFPVDKVIPHDLVLSNQKGEGFMIIDLRSPSERREFHLPDGGSYNATQSSFWVAKKATWATQTHQVLAALTDNKLQFFSLQEPSRGLSISFHAKISQVVGDFVALETGEIFRFNNFTSSFAKVEGVKLLSGEVLNINYSELSGNNFELRADTVLPGDKYKSRLLLEGRPAK